MSSGGKRTYADSLTYCQSLGMVVASIHSQAENDKVATMVQGVSYVAGLKVGTNWTWDDGSAWDWRNTKGDGLNSGESRLAIMPDGGWNDWLAGEAKLGVVCRKQPPKAKARLISTPLWT